MASSGPTSAAERIGERCQRTTSISAAEAINANGTAVALAEATTRSPNARLAVVATAADTSKRFSAYWVDAEIPIAVTIAGVPVPSTNETRTAAAPAASAKTEAL